MAKSIAWWVRYTHVQAGKAVGRGKFIVYAPSPEDARQMAADVLEAKGHVLNTRITSVKPKA